MQKIPRSLRFVIITQDSDQTPIPQKNRSRIRDLHRDCMLARPFWELDLHCGLKNPDVPSRFAPFPNWSTLLMSNTMRHNRIPYRPQFINYASVVLSLLFVSISRPLVAGHIADVTKRTEVGNDIVRIEEHWKARVAYPDPANGLPEFAFVLSPTGHFGGTHMVVLINHQTEPSFSRGGVELLACDRDSLTGFQNKLDGRVLFQTDDDIEVRMGMEVKSGELHYEVFKVKGKTWGDNKGPNWLHLQETTNLQNLNNYDPVTSHTWTEAMAGVRRSSDVLDAYWKSCVQKRPNSGGIVL